MFIEKWRNPTSLLLKYAQMTAPFSMLSFSLYREEDYLGCPSGYSKHTVTWFFNMDIVDYIILLTLHLTSYHMLVVSFSEWLIWTRLVLVEILLAFISNTVFKFIIKDFINSRCSGSHFSNNSCRYFFFFLIKIFRLPN